MISGAGEALIEVGVVQGGGGAGGGLDAEAEQAADLAGVSAGGVGLVEDAVFAQGLDTAGEMSTLSLTQRWPTELRRAVVR